MKRMKLTIRDIRVIRCNKRTSSDEETKIRVIRVIRWSSNETNETEIREIRAIRWQEKNIGGSSIYSIHSMITEDNIKQW